MINAIIRISSNLLYLVPLKVRKFKKNNPGIQVLVAGATKARKMKNNSEPGYERGWATARRNTLILATNGFHCGDWFIPLASVQDAKLFRITGGLLLKVNTTNDGFYQFGLQVDPAWEKQKVLPLKTERVVMKFSLFSLTVRLIAIAYLAWLIIRDLIYQHFSIATVIYIFFFAWFILPLVRMLLSKLKK